uniref:centrosomal protein of 295 kDa-like n=1 Tax=Styela clava TaxID=7725 RepID=UPI0019395A78|nr:centrosomal protein of 295 kDa-like [Styela clava]
MNTVLRPSPNETSRMMQDEIQRRRQLRILQVREQEKMAAIRIRRSMQEKHEKEMNNIANILHKKWQQDHKVALEKSEEKFTSCLKDVGSAHESAKENSPNQALTDAVTQENRKLAENRGIQALEHQREIKQMQEEETIEKRRRRHIALIKEKLRAKHVANLPQPMPNPADTYLDNTGTTNSNTWSSGSIPHHPGRYATIQVSDHESTMTTTISLGLPSNAIVERATAAEAATDARQEAEIEGERINLLQAERDRAVQECMEKAKVRHQAALEQARLDRESKDLIDDLKQLKMKDALRRQHHIEYKWEDNNRGKQACQELFGPPGFRFQESELFSRDLKKNEDEIPSCFEESDESTQDTTSWKPVPDETAQRPSQGRALNRLLKQIEVQRQQRKSTNGETSSGSSIRNTSIPDNFESMSTIREKSSQSQYVVDESSQAHFETEKLIATESQQSVPERDTIPKVPLNIRYVAPVTDLRNQGIGVMPQASPRKPAEKEVLDPIRSVTAQPLVSQPDKVPQDQPSTSESIKSKSESLLGKSLESMRNDEALLKSVKDFQQRLLQQHKSCAKIQEQIQRLEQKKAAIDGMVADVTKPKTY